MSDSCNCIDIKAEVVMDEPEIGCEVDVSEVILCSDGEDYKRGYEEGHALGLADGQTDGYKNGYNEGKKSEYDTFWDAYQQNGERTMYNYAFAYSGWNGDNFYPKYDIVPSTGGVNLFTESKNLNIDLIRRLTDCGVVLDTSQSTTIVNIFSSSAVTTVPHISSASSSNVTNIFANCTQLVTVEKLTVHKDITYSRSFYGCGALKNITIEGEIGNSISFSSSYKLTSASVDSIINALVDYSGTTTSPILTFHATVKGNLTDEQIATITSKNWTLA